jgi:hypothetical protein
VLVKNGWLFEVVQFGSVFWALLTLRQVVVGFNCRQITCKVELWARWLSNSQPHSSCQKSVDALEHVAETDTQKVYPSDYPIVEVRNMGKKAVVSVTACVMIIVVVFFEFFVFTTPTRQATKDPYFAAYYNEFNKTPTTTYNYNFSPPVSMYHALLVALESGGWNATSLSNMIVRASLGYWEFWNSSSMNGSEFLHGVTQPAIDYSPVQVNDTTYRYIWDIVVQGNAGVLSIPPPLCWVDAATGEIVPTGPLE